MTELATDPGTTTRKAALPGWYLTELPFSVALVAPAVRCVVVAAHAFREEGPETNSPLLMGHQIVPIVAIRSTVRNRYEARRTAAQHQPPDDGATHEEMLANGWTFEARDTVNDMLVITSDYGLADVESSFDAVNEVFVVVACPWDPSQDNERLQPFIESVRKQAIERVRTGT